MSQVSGKFPSRAALGRDDFRIDIRRFRRMLQANGYRELPILGDHTLALSDLPAHHKDPFDRMLVAQAHAERLTLVTSDTVLGNYGTWVRVV